MIIAFTGNAQKKIKEKDLIGQWKMVINLEEGFEKAKEELDDNDDEFLGKLILSSIEGFASAILDEVDIYMDFQKDGKLRVIVEAFDEKEVEYSEWIINDKGFLLINDGKNDVDIDHWILEDDVLVGYDEDGEKNMAYLVKII
tara:strand:- start:5313 stop:5741 length:429 start_codon:yes stop_codon:yes gene_type:complete